MEEGKFITFEGGEGVGKSTQLARLAKALSAHGIDVLPTREPGGSAGAEQIRDLLVTGVVERWTPISELLLLFAARADHVEKTIKPALSCGTWVLCDRFSDSTLAYQGYGHGVRLEVISQLHDLVVGKFQPDFTLYLDINVDDGLRRANNRKRLSSHELVGEEDRFERMNLPFHEKIRHGFKKIVDENSDRCILIDASKDENCVFDAIFQAVKGRFSLA